MYTNLVLINRNTRRFITNRVNIKTPCTQFRQSVKMKYGLFRSTRNETASIIHVTPITINNRRYNVKLKFRLVKMFEINMNFVVMCAIHAIQLPIFICVQFTTMSCTFIMCCHLFKLLLSFTNS